MINPTEKKVLTNCFLQKWTRIQECFYRERIKGGKFKFSFETYLKFKKYYQFLHPFQFVKSNDDIVHVGFSSEFIDYGMSYPIIFSFFSNHVTAIDANLDNVKKLSQFSKGNKLNIETVYSGVSDLKGILEFDIVETLSDGDGSSGSMISQMARESKSGHKNYKNKKIPTDTLDNLISKNVDILSLTINGAEMLALKGASRLMQNERMKIFVPLQTSTNYAFKWRKCLISFLLKRGYNLAIANAPHRPWQQDYIFYFLVATKGKIVEELQFEQVSNLNFL